MTPAHVKGVLSEQTNLRLIDLIIIMNKQSKEQIEEVLEKSMFASRWFMAPVYIVLSASLAVITLKVIQEFVNYLPLFLDLKIKELLLFVLRFLIWL